MISTKYIQRLSHWEIVLPRWSR